MILVGLDFRDDSWAALKEARSLAGATGMSLEVLHVWEYGAGEKWEPEAEEMAALEVAGVPLDALRVREGVPWVELLRYAKEGHARIIVAGRHGRSGFQPLALGSTAQRLATNSREPVLLVSRAVVGNKAPGRGDNADPGPKEEPNGTPTPSEAN